MKFLFDIGATHFRLASVTENGVRMHLRVDTPSDPEEAIRVFENALAGTEIDSLTGGIPCIVAEDGSIRECTNLPEWKGFAFKRALEAAVPTTVRVRNDAELAGLGEAVYGAGRGSDRVAYIGMGTGIGTSLVVRGVIVPHSSDEGRDIVIHRSEGSSLEELIGGRALAMRHDPSELSREEWERLTPLLIEGVRNAVSLWNPTVVVLGGSLVNDTDGFRVSEVAAAIPTPVVHAQLGDESGLYGAKAWE